MMCSVRSRLIGEEKPQTKAGTVPKRPKWWRRTAMLMSDLIKFMHCAITGTDDGGGDFLLQLSEESLKKNVRGPGRNKLYGDLKGINADN